MFCTSDGYGARGRFTSSALSRGVVADGLAAVRAGRAPVWGGADVRTGSSDRRRPKISAQTPTRAARIRIFIRADRILATVILSQVHRQLQLHLQRRRTLEVPQRQLLDHQETAHTFQLVEKPPDRLVGPLDAHLHRHLGEGGVLHF